MVVHRDCSWAGLAAGWGAGQQLAEGPQGSWQWLPTVNRLWWGAGYIQPEETHIQHRTVGHLQRQG